MFELFLIALYGTCIDLDLESLDPNLVPVNAFYKSISWLIKVIIVAKRKNFPLATVANQEYFLALEQDIKLH